MKAKNINLSACVQYQLDKLNEQNLDITLQIIFHNWLTCDYEDYQPSTDIAVYLKEDMENKDTKTMKVEGRLPLEVEIVSLVSDCIDEWYREVFIPTEW